MKWTAQFLEDVTGCMSPPSRGAWIEIPDTAALWPLCVVAPLAGGVD